MSWAKESDQLTNGCATTAYGGYSNTAYGAGGGEDGGGFVFGGSQSGSQQAGRGYSDESLRPVTIKQLLDAEQPYPDANFRIDGVEVAQVTLVGQVRAVSPQTTNVTLRLDDGTGVIEVKQWLDADKPDDAKGANYALDAYVRVYGRVKSFNNKRHIGAHVIKPVHDFNEVNYHLLESTYVHLYFTKPAAGGNAVGAGAGAGAGNAADDDSMFVDGGYGAAGSAPNLSGVSAKARKMFNWLQSSDTGNEGVNIHVIAQSTGLSVPDAMAASEELIQPGLIYTTVDDETFAILSY
ncbi:Replication factor A protein 2 [Diatrype stigma]|uniref:Replication factor A protein 2 n=1 Tax=Diatrype stigma TaxID=117547 RepID=A0AAN9UPH6_9PEZI